VTRKLPLTIACNDYDRTRPIKDGRVAVEGCEVTYLTYEAEEMFFRALRYDEFDVAELSFSGYLMTVARDRAPYIAIPAFVSRFFRHSAAFIRTDRGIRTPADLSGRTVGVPEYPQTAGVWMRGIFKDEYGLQYGDVRWRSGGLEEPGREERVPFQLDNGVDLQPIPRGQTLNRMLIDGELDAVFTARPLSAFAARAPNVGRLFPNYREVERDYFRRTRIFPIMHVIGIRKTLVAQHPWLPGNLYKAFRQAKSLALKELGEVGWPHVTLPWVDVEMAESSALMGADYWRYGMSESSHEIEALIGYSYDQGLLPRKPAPEELFHPSTLEVSKI
jgi:4,5-dihydroxyphthalate decarboxylase